jgi:hypothetical protein
LKIWIDSEINAPADYEWANSIERAKALVLMATITNDYTWEPMDNRWEIDKITINKDMDVDDFLSWLRENNMIELANKVQIHVHRRGNR